MPNAPTAQCPFHLAIEVDDLDEARRFYGDLLGCPEGRTAPTWIDFNFFGHQLTAHLRAGDPPQDAASEVDARQVPLPHFGLVLDMSAWKSLADRLRASGIDFVIEPYVRFRGQVGEQATMFLRDPSGNALEFKAFPDRGGLFER